jgi:hypothetical protein
MSLPVRPPRSFQIIKSDRARIQGFQESNPELWCLNPGFVHFAECREPEVEASLQHLKIPTLKTCHFALITRVPEDHSPPSTRKLDLYACVALVFNWQILSSKLFSISIALPLNASVDKWTRSRDRVRDQENDAHQVAAEYVDNLHTTFGAWYQRSSRRPRERCKQVGALYPQVLRMTRDVIWKVSFDVHGFCGTSRCGGGTSAN